MVDRGDPPNVFLYAAGENLFFCKLESSHVVRMLHESTMESFAVVLRRDLRYTMLQLWAGCCNFGQAVAHTTGSSVGDIYRGNRG